MRITLVKDGDHRLSRDQDIALLCRTVGELLDSFSGGTVSVAPTPGGGLTVRLVLPQAQPNG